MKSRNSELTMLVSPSTNLEPNFNFSNLEIINKEKNLDKKFTLD